MVLQEIRRRPNGNEAEIIEQERKRRQELYQQQLNERRKSHESLLQVQEQLLKIFAKIKVGLLNSKRSFRIILASPEYSFLSNFVISSFCFVVSIDIFVDNYLSCSH